jgi:hypothetical protein
MEGPTVTIRDYISQLQRELADAHAASDGHTLRACALRASSLLGNVNTEMLDAEMAYRAIEAAQALAHSAAAAKVYAMNTEEYRRWRRAENAHDELKAVQRACESALRSLSFEATMTRG